MKLFVLIVTLSSLVECNNNNNQPIINQVLDHLVHHEQVTHQLKNSLETQTFFEDFSLNQFKKYKEQFPSQKCFQTLTQMPQLFIAKCMSFIYLFIHSFYSLIIHSFHHELINL